MKFGKKIKADFKSEEIKAAENSQSEIIKQEEKIS